MPPRKRSEDPAQPVKIRLRESIRQQLESVAAERGVSLNQEITERLVSSIQAPQKFVATSSDPKTNAIADMVAEVIRSAGRVAGSWSHEPWYDQSFAFNQVREAIDVAMRSIAPAGSPDDLPPNLSRSSDRTLLMATGKLAADSIIALIELCDERDDHLQRPPEARPEALTKNERELGTRLRLALGHIAERIRDSGALDEITQQIRDQ